MKKGGVFYGRRRAKGPQGQKGSPERGAGAKRLRGFFCTVSCPPCPPCVNAPPILSSRLAEKKERVAPGVRKKRAPNAGNLVRVVTPYSRLSYLVPDWSVVYTRSRSLPRRARFARAAGRAGNDGFRAAEGVGPYNNVPCHGLTVGEGLAPPGRYRPAIPNAPGESAPPPRRHASLW